MTENDEHIERACEVMHNAYERAAVGTRWETQERSRKPWGDVPEANKATMRAAVGALMDWLSSTPESTPLTGDEEYPGDQCPEHGPYCSGPGCCCRDKHRQPSLPSAGTKEADRG